MQKIQMKGKQPCSTRGMQGPDPEKTSAVGMKDIIPNAAFPVFGSKHLDGYCFVGWKRRTRNGKYKDHFECADGKEDQEPYYRS